MHKQLNRFAVKRTQTKQKNTMKKYKTEQERKQAKRESNKRYRAKVKAAKQQLTNKPAQPAPYLPPPTKRRTYVGISRDHSGSMGSIRRAAARDYNAQIAQLAQGARDAGQETFATVVRCGDYRGMSGPYSGVCRETVNAPINVISPLMEHNYLADGWTPLWDSIGDLINILSGTPDANDPGTTFLIMVITDGEENQSRHWSVDLLMKRIKELQATDRWTFTFRVPRNMSRRLVQLGIPAGNILEWDQSDEGMSHSTQATTTAVASYFSNVSRGVNATQKFYADLSGVSSSQVASKCVDISAKVNIWPVAKAEAGAEIRPFVEKRLNKPMKKGAAFYQLTKPERNVQSYKKIIIRDKNDNAIYGGDDARRLLGLPVGQNIKLEPGKLGNFEVFVQSTSVNRKLVGSTQLVYWEDASI